MTNQTVEQTELERQAKLAAADAIEAVYAWALAEVKAHPAVVSSQAWRSGTTLHVHYDEHDAMFVLGMRTAEGERVVMQAVSADWKNPQTFGRPLDALLLEAMQARFPASEPGTAH